MTTPEKSTDCTTPTKNTHKESEDESKDESKSEDESKDDDGSDDEPNLSTDSDSDDVEPDEPAPQKRLFEIPKQKKEGDDLQQLFRRAAILRSRRQHVKATKVEQEYTSKYIAQRTIGKSMTNRVCVLLCYTQQTTSNHTHTHP